MSSRGPAKTQKPKSVPPATVKAGKKPGGASGRRWGRWLLAAWLLLVVWVTVEYVRLPDVRGLAKDTPRTTALMDKRAEEAREEGRKPRHRQTWVDLSAVPPHVLASILLSEDARFYEHNGVDWVEVEDALEDAWESGALGRGASTLTQQLAKNLYLSTDRSLLRKGKEYLLARRMEEALPKKRILTLYVNVVEWGDGVYGIEAAAHEHFGVSARGLSVAQGAMLAAMLPAPRRWLPARRPAVLRKRAANIIDRLERFNRIPAAQAAAARAELARFFGVRVPAAPVAAAPAARPAVPGAAAGAATPEPEPTSDTESTGTEPEERAPEARAPAASEPAAPEAAPDDAVDSADDEDTGDDL